MGLMYPHQRDLRHRNKCQGHSMQHTAASARTQGLQTGLVCSRVSFAVMSGVSLQGIPCWQRASKHVAVVKRQPSASAGPPCALGRSQEGERCGRANCVGAQIAERKGARPPLRHTARCL